MESVSECLEHSANDVFKRQIKEENTILKMCVRDKKDKVLELENTTLSAHREPLFLPGLLYSCVQKGQEQTQNRSLETT